MTTHPISPLRQRMIEDMHARQRGRHCQCEQAWNSDPVFGVIAVENCPLCLWHQHVPGARCCWGGIGVITMDTIGKVRRAYWVQGKKIKATPYPDKAGCWSKAADLQRFLSVGTGFPALPG